MKTVPISENSWGYKNTWKVSIFRDIKKRTSKFYIFYPSRSPIHTISSSPHKWKVNIPPDTTYFKRVRFFSLEKLKISNSKKKPFSSTLASHRPTKNHVKSIPLVTIKNNLKVSIAFFGKLKIRENCLFLPNNKIRSNCLFKFCSLGQTLENYSFVPNKKIREKCPFWKNFL